MIIKGKKKEDYIQNITNRANTIYSNITELNQVERFIKTNYFSGTSEIHKTYVTRFNAIDMADRWLGEVDSHHRTYNWKTKMLVMILRIGILNSWIYHVQIQYQDWIDFRRLGIQLMKY